MTEADTCREFVTPKLELWQRLTASAHLPEPAAAHLLEPFNLMSGKVPRYYQHIAIQRVIESILLGQRRILATLTTERRCVLPCASAMALEHPDSQGDRHRLISVNAYGV